jgi:hypothetical protein
MEEPQFAGKNLLPPRAIMHLERKVRRGIGTVMLQSFVDVSKNGWISIKKKKKKKR